MSLSKRFSILLLLALTLLSSCGKDDDSNIKINIDEEFDVQLFEKLQPGDNGLVVHIKSKELLDCSNYDLGHSTSTSSGEVIISIDEVQLEGECDSIEAIAETAAQLGTLSKGSHDVELNLALGSITNEGEIFVTNDQYVLEMESTHGIVVKNTELNVIPDHYCWGYIVLTDNNASALRNEFLSSVLAYAPSTNISSGYYGHFLFQNGKIDMNTEMMEEPIPSASVQFIYELGDNRTEVLEYVKSFQEIHADEVEIVFMTGAGEIL
ncbi:MAG: hypothetical protein AB8F74_14855 [Saprospiraceae bacterium]